MDRRTFIGVITSILGLIIMIGWVWLPDSYLYKINPPMKAVYTNLASLWAWIGITCMVACGLYAFYKVGVELYDEITKIDAS